MTRHIARPPRVRFPNVERRARGGVFVFRARVMHAGRTEVGSWRSTQREAFLDVEGLRAAQARRSPIGPVSIVRALAAVVWDARARGLQRITIRRHLLYEARWWLEWWEGEDPLELVDEEAVLRVVRTALAEGRSPETLRTKDLHFLDRTFRQSGLQSPVPAVKARASAALKGRRQQGPVLLLEELQRILERVRSERFVHRLRGREVETVIPEREHHADLMLLVALTGIRCGEVARLRVADIEIERGILAVQLPKDRSNPRRIPISEPARAAIERLLSRALPDGRLISSMAYLSCAIGRWSRRLDEPLLHARGLRHFLGTELLRRGAPITSVRDVLGHRSLATTNRYLHALDAPLRIHVSDLAAELSTGARASAVEPEA